jgi:CRISPR/Cas system CSM-associated protein Csm3 (group 7 of RAMP superfamily)
MNQELTGAKRIYILGTVKITAPLHIGSGETVPRPGRLELDMPIQLDSEGKPYLPATAIGGLLRGTAENLITAMDNWNLSHLISLFGEAREADDVRRKKKKELAHPSRLRIQHATLRGEWNQVTTIRDGVGIDRQRSSAREGALYNYEVVPAGTEFSLSMELRDGVKEDKELLALTIEALRQLPTAIGARGNSGLGALQLCLDKVVEVDLTNSETLFKFLCQENQFDPQDEEYKSWEAWREFHLPKEIALKQKKPPAAWRIPQAITFTYRLQVEDPLLIRGREAPEDVLEDYQARRSGREASKEETVVHKVNPPYPPKDLGETERSEAVHEVTAERSEQEKQVPNAKETIGIDAAWIGIGENPAERCKWEPIIPGSSLRGVFRSHCERILRTLSWHYAKERLPKKPGEEPDEAEIRAEYEKSVAASDPLESNNKSYLRSSGFAIQEKVSDYWKDEMRGKEDEALKRYRASRKISGFIWDKSDPGERMWGSSQWASRVSVSEAYLPADQKDKWEELLFQNVAINRFTGGAAENKLFNALAITDATFEGTIAVFGDELWMLGLIALLFKDLHDGLVRVGSGKTRGRGKVKGWLTQVEVKALPGSSVAEVCSATKPAEEQVWKTWRSEMKPDAFLSDAKTWLKALLEKGVSGLQMEVQEYQKPEPQNKEGKNVHDNSSQDS